MNEVGSLFPDGGSGEQAISSDERIREVESQKVETFESSQAGDKNWTEKNQSLPNIAFSSSASLENIEVERHLLNQDNREGSSPSELMMRDAPMIFDAGELVESLEADNEDLDSSDEEDSEEKLKELIMAMGRVKATLYLRHSMAFFLAFLVMARFSLELIESSSCIREMLIVLYGYLCYSFFEEVNFYYKYKTSDNDTKISYIYAGLDVFSILCSLVILHLKFLKVLPSGNVASLPGLVICGLFYFSSYRRQSAKKLFLIKRFLEAVQVYLIEAKVDGTLDLPWKSILVYTWIYIGIRILLLVSSLRAVKVFLPGNCKRASILLSIWHCLYIGLLLIVLLIYIGYSRAYDSKGGLNLLKACLIGAQYFSGLLLCYTILTKPFLLMIFSRVSSMHYQSSELGEVILDPLSVGISKRVKIEERDTYFSMVSWTYYKRLRLALLVINKERLKELELNILPEKVRQITKELQSVYEFLADNLKDNRLIQKVKITMNNNYMISFFSSENHQQGNSFFYFKSQPSFDSGLQTISQKESDNENMCYVCLQEVADAVVINCGHGGFCYKCAEKYMLIKSECMACRGQAEKIAKIKTQPIFGNIFKGDMIGRLAFQVEDAGCQWFLD